MQHAPMPLIAIRGVEEDFQFRCGQTLGSHLQRDADMAWHEEDIKPLVEALKPFAKTYTERGKVSEQMLVTIGNLKKAYEALEGRR